MRLKLVFVFLIFLLVGWVDQPARAQNGYGYRRPAREVVVVKPRYRRPRRRVVVVRPQPRPRRVVVVRPQPRPVVKVRL